jgi:hypothetical protein
MEYNTIMSRILPIAPVKQKCKRSEKISFEAHRPHEQTRDMTTSKLFDFDSMPLKKRHSALTHFTMKYDTITSRIPPIAASEAKK